MDIDIDISPDSNLEIVFPSAVRASVVTKKKLGRHPVGLYLQNMPIDPITGLAAIPYDKAKEFGFFKFDFLNLHVLQHYTKKNDIRKLAEEDPNWKLLLDPEVVTQLFHIGKHYDIVSVIQPESVQELADCLALIRPGKRQFLESYVRNPDKIRSELYKREDNELYAYKRSHAIAYALVIVLQLHALGGGLSLQYDEQLEW